MAKRKKQSRDVYQEVTNTILEYLDQGVVPWRHPIAGHGEASFPKNLTTDKHYRGINFLMLGMIAWAKGYGSPYWLTFKQAQSLGGQVRKGEKASLVTFWKVYEKEDDSTGETVNLPVLRHYNVFSVEQCEGIDYPGADAQTIQFNPIAVAEELVAGYAYPPKIIHGGGRNASYVRKLDEIHIAQPEFFESTEAYYATLYHELTHSTGHEKRLDRIKGKNFGDADYAREELIAEMGAAFLCAHAGISPATVEQSAAYIDGWRKRISEDKKLVITAAGKAQKAVDHILGVAFGEAARPPPEAQQSRQTSPTPTPSGENPPIEVYVREVFLREHEANGLVLDGTGGVLDGTLLAVPSDPRPFDQQVRANLDEINGRRGELRAATLVLTESTKPSVALDPSAEGEHGECDYCQKYGTGACFARGNLGETPCDNLPGPDELLARKTESARSVASIRQMFHPPEPVYGMPLPKPTLEAIDAGMFGVCGDGTLCPSEEEIRSIVTVQVEEMTGCLAEAERLCRAGRDANKQKDLQLRYLSASGAYEEAFGHDARRRLDACVAQRVREQLGPPPPVEYQRELF